MEHEPMNAKLLDCIQRAHQNELAFASNLSEAEQQAVGLPDRWSAKDLIAHIGSWLVALDVGIAGLHDGADQSHDHHCFIDSHTAIGDTELDGGEVF